MNILRMVLTMGSLILLWPILLYALLSDKLKRNQALGEGPDIASLRFYEERDAEDKVRDG